MTTPDTTDGTATATATDNGIDRRDILRATGATVGFAGLATRSTASSGSNTLDIRHVCHGTADYTVCVTGTLTKTSNVEGDDYDAIMNNGQCAKGGLGPKRGRDTYTYTGEVRDVRVTGPAVVEANGTRLHTPDCLADTTKPDHQPPDDVSPVPDCDDPTVKCSDDEFCPLDNSIEVATSINSNAPVRYAIAVSGVIELESGERVTECTGRIDAQQGSRYKKEFRYSGEIRRLKLTGPGHVCFDQPTPCRG